MLHIILLILKIIGIILLCILSVLLLTACCALFVPVKYRIEVFREEGEGKPPVVVRAKITWMLHLVNILICYPADVYVRARIFFFTLFRLPVAEKEQKKSGRQKKEKKEVEQQDDKDGRAGPDVNAEERITGTEAHKKNDGGSTGYKKQGDQAVNSKPMDPGQTEQADQVAGQGRENVLSMDAGQNGSEREPSGFIGKVIRRICGFIDKIKEIAGKMKAAAENIQYTIRRFCDKIKFTLDNIQYYREVLVSEPFRQAWELCRKQIGIILKELKPDKFEADMIIGAEDPAATGEILAVYGMLYPWIGQHVRIAGDFERAHIEGCIYIKGKIRAFTFLRVAVKVYFNHDIKALIKLFKKEAV